MCLDKTFLTALNRKSLTFTGYMGLILFYNKLSRPKFCLFCKMVKYSWDYDNYI